MTLQEKCIFVTGATGGLGQALSYALAKQGATLILSSKTQPKLEALYDGIIAAGGPEPIVYPLDLETLTPAIAKHTAHAIAQQIGTLDAIVHTAAYLGSLTPLLHTPLSQWEKVMQINLHSPMILSQGLLPLLKQAPKGAMLWTLDRTHSTESTAYWGAYAVAKAGIQALATILAAECPTLSIQAIHPGPIRTDLRRQAYPGEKPVDIPLAESVLPLFLEPLISTFNASDQAD